MALRENNSGSQFAFINYPNTSSVINVESAMPIIISDRELKIKRQGKRNGPRGGGMGGSGGFGNAAGPGQIVLAREGETTLWVANFPLGSTQADVFNHFQVCATLLCA